MNRSALKRWITPHRGQDNQGERIGGVGGFNPFITDKVGNRIPFEGLTPTAIDEQYGKGDACGRLNVEEKDEKDETLDERQKEEFDERALDSIEREENPKDWEEGDY